MIGSIGMILNLIKRKHLLWGPASVSGHKISILGESLDMDAKVKDLELVEERNPQVLSGTITEAPINASGHRQELDRNFNLVSICALAITTGNTWVALGGTYTYIAVFSHLGR